MNSDCGERKDLEVNTAEDDPNEAPNVTETLMGSGGEGGTGVGGAPMAALEDVDERGK